MPALARGETNTTSGLNWFITVNGTLTDAYEVGYQIYDITGGLPGAQVFPTTPGDWETVTSGAGNFMTGSYYAYDNTAGTGYTVPITENIGTHRITWRWKISAGSPYQSDSEDFEVLVASAGSTADTYITIQDIRDAGLVDEVAYPDSMVLAYIEMWQAFIDRACRQWFAPRTLTLYLDGTDSDAIHLGVPIISIDYIKINGSTTVLDTSLYKVYSSLSYPDDRKNPRIKLVNTRQFGSIFSPSIVNKPIFAKGRQNQEISGIFGYVESDMTTPKLIKRALTKLVIEKITRPIYATESVAGNMAPPILGAILEEETDYHRILYASPGGEIKARSPYLTGITQDSEIIEIIKLYRSPIGIATPASGSYN